MHRTHTSLLAFAFAVAVPARAIAQTPTTTTPAKPQTVKPAPSPKHETQAQLQKEAKIAEAAASATALAAVPGGKIKSHELEREKGKLIYSFDIKTSKPGVTEVNVDAITGKIVSVEQETPAQEAKEKH